MANGLAERQMIWKSRLFWKVVATTVGFIGFFSLLLGVMIAERQRQDLKTQLLERLRVSAIQLSKTVHPLLMTGEIHSLQEIVHELGDETRTRLTVIQVDGTVIADSGLATSADVANMDNHRHREESA